MTVSQVVDPFGAFGGGTPPAGSRYVYVGLTIANGGDGPLTVDPATLFVVDAAGFVYRPSDLFGGAELQTVAPGASVAGGVVFAVPEDAVLTAVYHDPAEDRLIWLALLGGAAPVVETTPAGGTATPVPPASVTPVAGDVDCDAFAAYLAGTQERIARLEAIGAEAADLVSIAMADPFEAATTVQGWADDTAALAEEQAQAAVPAGLEELNNQAVEAFHTYADAFGQLATGLENFDPDALGAFQTILTEGDTRMTQTIDALNALAGSCGLDGIVEG
jgi:hypothetical protein